ncbi:MULTISPECIES: hypothetical protein [Candidatus Ichthyocystis]|uniref:Uncharacterized protein n=1 Tax=Candidatus Ichthyocystis hellenicum TaxID=1561003 RepID=A0A0S4M951_9BURK|nr:MULTISPECIES: hypothetical protein [Ichthyocystis]CUT17972.1 hypothetical protein Ark11_1159 [Candidatus Ichthyocystis hellenicum]
MENYSTINGVQNTEEHSSDQESEPSCKKSESICDNSLSSLDIDNSIFPRDRPPLRKMRSFLWSQNRSESIVSNYISLPIGRSSLNIESESSFYEDCSNEDTVFGTSKIKRGFMSISMESLNTKDITESAKKTTFKDNFEKRRRSSSLSHIDKSILFEEKKPNLYKYSISEVDLKDITKRTKKYLAVALAEAEFLSTPKTIYNKEVAKKDNTIENGMDEVDFRLTGMDEVDFIAPDHKKINLIYTKTKLGDYDKIDVRDWREESKECNQRRGTRYTDDYLRNELLEKTLLRNPDAETGKGINKISPLALGGAHSKFSGKTIFIHKSNKGNSVSTNLGNIIIPGNTDLKESLKSQYLGLIYLIFNDLKELEKSIPEILETTKSKDQTCFVLDNFVIKSKKVLLMFFNLICDLPETILSNPRIITSKEEYESAFTSALNTKLAEKIKEYEKTPEYSSILKGMKIGGNTDIYSYLFKNIQSKEIIFSILHESRLFLERNSNYKPKSVPEDALNIRHYLYESLFSSIFNDLVSILEKRINKIKIDNNLQNHINNNIVSKEELSDYLYIGKFYISQKLVLGMESCVDRLLELNKDKLSKFEIKLTKGIALGYLSKKDIEIHVDNFFEKEIFKKDEENYNQLFCFMREFISRVTIVTLEGKKIPASIEKKEEIISYFKFFLSKKLNSKILLGNMVERISETTPIIFNGPRSLSLELANSINKVCKTVSVEMDKLVSLSIDSVTDLYLNGSTVSIDEVIEAETSNLHEQFYYISKSVCHGEDNLKSQKIIGEIYKIVDYKMSDLLKCYGNILEKRLENIYTNKIAYLNKEARTKIPDQWKPIIFHVSQETSESVIKCIDDVCKEILLKFKIVTKTLEERVCNLYIHSEEENIANILEKEASNCKQLFIDISKQSCRGESNLRAKKILCEISKAKRSSEKEILRCYGNLLERRLNNVYKFELINLEHKIKHRAPILYHRKYSSTNK